ncbi:gliding motility-associated protein GldM [Dysgonomonas sp. PH5-45]|nr:gliding motility-associated protein GldM [Dysgonomonas sp. PH5-45]
MYLVFIAMLALNVSSEVLEGFELVEEGLQQTIVSTESQNKLTMDKLNDSYEQNKVKAEVWYKHANAFTQKSDSLYNMIQNMKEQIVKYADGEEGNVRNINNKEGVDAAFNVMLGKDQKAKTLKTLIDQYRIEAGKLVSDSKLKAAIDNRLKTEPSDKAKENNKNWEQALFDQMPTAAAVTLLTKIQSDVRAVQGEVLADLLNSIGGGDFRVNSLRAEVIPRSMIVMQGGSYEGEIILAAVDTTKQPRIYIGDTMLPADRKGAFQIGAGAAGANKKFTGRIEWDRIDKDPLRIPFEATYSVVEPMATVASVMMNVLYAGIPNELSISVPGVTNDKISAAVTSGNGSLSKTAKGWVAQPSQVGKDFIVSVTAEMNGRRMEVAKQVFKVRALPKASPFIQYTDASGNPKKYDALGREKISKAAIVSAGGIKAAIDDGLIYREFTVLSFTVRVFGATGEGSMMASNSGRFSESQLDAIRRLSRGMTFLITDIKAKGPDGITQDLPPMEIKTN